MAFVKGKSGNPSGRPKRDLELKAAAREYTAAALKVLANVMENGESESARVSAAQTLLDRGWGKATQEIQHKGGIEVAVGGVDSPTRSETYEEWSARRQRELSPVVAAAGASTSRH